MKRVGEKVRVYLNNREVRGGREREKIIGERVERGGVCILNYVQINLTNKLLNDYTKNNIWYFNVLPVWFRLPMSASFYQ